MTGSAFWKAVFGNDNPVHVEIGPGRGEFLLSAARANPHRSFYGIERSRRRAAEIQRRIDSAGLPNARVLLADATCVIGLLPDACVASYIVQFPDPWWKRRHHRRRLFTEALVASLARTLAPGGTIHVMTDVEDYFDMAQTLLDAHPGLRRIRADHWRTEELTSFERKARARESTIFASVHQRRTAEHRSGSAAKIVTRSAALPMAETEDP